MSVVIVGGGPVGLFLALRLARAKIPITLLEAETSAGNGAKAITYQPNIFPELQRAGVFEDLKAAGTFIGPIAFRKTSNGEALVTFPSPPGAPKILILPQYRFVEILEGHLKGMEGVSVIRGVRLVDVDESRDDSIVAIARNDQGEEQRFEADFIVGADGGRSSVRKTCSISFEGNTLSSQLVATDVRYPFEVYGFTDAQFMIDPKDYGLIARIDDKGLWRVSFCISKDANRDDMESQLPVKYEAMFPGPRPLQYRVENVAPYKCQQICASTMRKGRVLLAGDAAHLTNPYAGLGLTTGFFDAASLADTLISILTRGASHDLLDAWSAARLAVYHNIVDPISRTAYYRVQDPDADTLTERDMMLKAAKAGKMPPPPSLATDVTNFDGFIA